MVGMDKNKEILDDTLEILMIQMIKEKFENKNQNEEKYIITKQELLLRFYKEKGCLDLHYKLLIDYIDKLQQENKELKERLKVLEDVLIRDKFNFSKPQVLTFKVNLLESRIDKALLKINQLYEYGDEWHWDGGAIRDYVEDIEKVLKDSDVDEN